MMIIKKQNYNKIIILYKKNNYSKIRLQIILNNNQNNSNNRHNRTIKISNKNHSLQCCMIREVIRFNKLYIMSNSSSWIQLMKIFKLMCIVNRLNNNNLNYFHRNKKLQICDCHQSQFFQKTKTINNNLKPYNVIINWLLKLFILIF